MYTGNVTYEIPDTRQYGEAELRFEAGAGGLQPGDEGDYLCVAEEASFGNTSVSIFIDVLGEHW